MCVNEHNTKRAQGSSATCQWHRTAGEEQSNNVGGSARPDGGRVLITSECGRNLCQRGAIRRRLRLAPPLSLAPMSICPSTPPPTCLLTTSYFANRRTLPTYIKPVGSAAYLLMPPLPSSVARPLLMQMKPSRRCNAQNFNQLAAMVKHIE